MKKSDMSHSCNSNWLEGICLPVRTWHRTKVNKTRGSGLGVTGRDRPWRFCGFLLKIVTYRKISVTGRDRPWQGGLGVFNPELGYWIQGYQRWCQTVCFKIFWLQWWYFTTTTRTQKNNNSTFLGWVIPWSQPIFGSNLVFFAKCHWWELSVSSAMPSIEEEMKEASSTYIFRVVWN